MNERQVKLILTGIKNKNIDVIQAAMNNDSLCPLQISQLRYTIINISNGMEFKSHVTAEVHNPQYISEMNDMYLKMHENSYLDSIDWCYDDGAYLVDGTNMDYDNFELKGDSERIIYESNSDFLELFKEIKS